MECIHAFVDVKSNAGVMASETGHINIGTRLRVELAVFKFFSHVTCGHSRSSLYACCRHRGAAESFLNRHELDEAALVLTVSSQ